MKREVRGWISVTFKVTSGVVLSIVFLYWAFSGIDLSDVVAASRQISLDSIIGLTMLTLGTVVLRGWRWMILFRQLSNAHLWYMTESVALGYVSNLVIPRSGEALRALRVGRNHGVSFAAVFATVVIERALDVIWLLIFLGLTIPLLPAPVVEMYPWLGTLLPFASMGVLISIAGVVGLLYFEEALCRVAAAMLSPISPGLAQRVSGMITRFNSGLASVKDRRTLLAAMVSSLVLYVAYCLIVFVGMRAFGIEAGSPLGDANASIVVTTMSLLGTLIPTPGAIGSYHLLFSQTLTLGYGVVAHTAIACATLLHALANGLCILLSVPLAARKLAGIAKAV